MYLHGNTILSGRTVCGGCSAWSQFHVELINECFRVVLILIVGLVRDSTDVGWFPGCISRQFHNKNR